MNWKLEMQQLLAVTIFYLVYTEDLHVAPNGKPFKVTSTPSDNFCCSVIISELIIISIWDFNLDSTVFVAEFDYSSSRWAWNGSLPDSAASALLDLNEVSSLIDAWKVIHQLFYPCGK